MIIVAVALIASGYTLIYWGANYVNQWDSKSSLSQGTKTPPMSVLLGLTDASGGIAGIVAGGDKFTHDVPFPYTMPIIGEASKGIPGAGQTPAPSTGGTNQPGGADINPNFPGNGGQPMPNPGIPV